VLQLTAINHRSSLLQAACHRSQWAINLFENIHNAFQKSNYRGKNAKTPFEFKVLAMKSVENHFQPKPAGKLPAGFSRP
jgi:hypothetical protein